MSDTDEHRSSGRRSQGAVAAGDSWQMVGSWAATTGGQGSGGCGVKILLMSYHYVVS